MQTKLSIVEHIRAASQVFTHLASARTAVRGEVREQLASYGLRPDTYAILSIIHTSGGKCGNADVAESLGLPRGSTHRLLKGLQTEGLITSVQSADDKRFNSWLVSPEGEEVLREVNPFPSNGNYWTALVSMSPRDRREMFDDLASLVIGLASPQGATMLKTVLFGRDGRTASTTASFNPDLLGRLYLMLMTAHRLTQSEQTRHLQATTGGTIESAHYMTMFRAIDPCVVSDISDFLRLDPATTTRVVDHLVRLGYVSRTRSPVDGRQVIVRSTEAARELISAVTPFPPSGQFVHTLSRLPDGGERLSRHLGAFNDAISGRRSFPHPDYEALARGLSVATEEEAGTRAALDSDTYRKAMAQFATGVAVLTASFGDARRGITVNSVASVSLSPPLLLVCLIDAIPMLELVTSAGTFALNVLAEDQRNLAVRFGRAESADNPHTLEGVRWSAVDGVPVLDDALASVICRVDRMLEIGDHTVILVAPINAVHDPDGPQRAALTFFNSTYHITGP